MQVKMFVVDNLPTAEQEVNEWLQSVSAAVRHVSQSQCERNGRFLFVISIYYTSENAGCLKT